MIVSLDDLKAQITTTLPDDVLISKLAAIEQLVRNYTHNNFRVRNRRMTGKIEGGKIALPFSFLKVGDTVDISESVLNDGTYEVAEVSGSTVTLSEDLLDEKHALVSLVRYPADVQQGAINLMKWDLENRDKVGIASETISRHSVTYFDLGKDNTANGFPDVLIGFLKPYKKARF